MKCPNLVVRFFIPIVELNFLYWTPTSRQFSFCFFFLSLVLYGNFPLYECSINDFINSNFIQLFILTKIELYLLFVLPTENGWWAAGRKRLSKLYVNYLANLLQFNPAVFHMLLTLAAPGKIHFFPIEHSTSNSDTETHMCNNDLLHVCALDSVVPRRFRLYVLMPQFEAECSIQKFHGTRIWRCSVKLLQHTFGSFYNIVVQHKNFVFLSSDIRYCQNTKRPKETSNLQNVIWQCTEVWWVVGQIFAVIWVREKLIRYYILPIWAI